jgi:hypothetical protein
MKTMLATLMMACAALVACDKADEKKPEAETPAPATATPANTAATPQATAATPTVDIAEADLVTAADMEDDAEKTITKKNFKSELASLEAEIAKD